MPGIRRGYAIVPYAARPGETEGQCQERLRGTMARVRQANIQETMGSRDPDVFGSTFRRLPTGARGRRGKIKRAVLEAGGREEQLEVDKNGGRVCDSIGMVKGKKVAGEVRHHMTRPYKSDVDGWMKTPWPACSGKNSGHGGPSKGPSVDYWLQKMHANPSYAIFVIYRRGLIHFRRLRPTRRGSFLNTKELLPLKNLVNSLLLLHESAGLNKQTERPSFRVSAMTLQGHDGELEYPHGTLVDRRRNVGTSCQASSAPMTN